MTINGHYHCLNIHIPQGRMAADPRQLVCIQRPDPLNSLSAGAIKVVKQDCRRPAFQPDLLTGIKAINIKIRWCARAASRNSLSQGKKL